MSTTATYAVTRAVTRTRTLTGAVALAAVAAPAVAGAQAAATIYATPAAYAAAATSPLIAFNTVAPVADGARTLCSRSFVNPFAPGPDDGCRQAPTYQGFAFASYGGQFGTERAPLTLAGGPIRVRNSENSTLGIFAPAGITSFAATLVGTPFYGTPGGYYASYSVTAYDADGRVIVGTSPSGFANFPGSATPFIGFSAPAGSTIASLFIDQTGPGTYAAITITGLTFTATPEPGTLALTAVALGGLAVPGLGARRRRPA